jgi:hypothetical protein
LFRFRRMFITQAQFDDWANAAKRWHRVGVGFLVLLVAIGCTAAVVIMGPRLVREGSLLWFGTYAEGTVDQMKVEEHGKFKGGAQKYRITIDYHFTTADGSRHDGSTIRTDVRDPPEFKPGDAIGVYYAPSNPTNSVAEHNLRTDVYALVLFMPFLGVMGTTWPLHWAWRHWRWHRSRRASIPR